MVTPSSTPVESFLLEIIEKQSLMTALNFCKHEMEQRLVTQLRLITRSWNPSLSFILSSSCVRFVFASPVYT